MAGTIFICYRRGEDTPSAGWLHTQLTHEGTFKPEQVFRDVDGIAPGDDFVAVLEAQVAACDVLLCVIGRGWLAALHRLAQDNDYVRIELAAALASGKKVIPLLMDQAQMPAPARLPEELRALTRRQAASLRHDHFKTDLRLLIPVLEKALVPLPQPERPPGREFKLPPRGTVFRDVDAPWCPEMVVIPAGAFLMGAPGNETGRSYDEGPQHRVTIGTPFALGRYAVTFDEYDHFCKVMKREKPMDEGWGRGRRPVVNVSWQDAVAYSEWLAKETGKPYRLPSEAEWEYACRAGTTTRYAFGDDIKPENANFGESKLGRTTEVGTYPPNPWGLYDMHGNVWEWVEDCWHQNYNDAPGDGQAWHEKNGGDCSRRVLRGGSWNLNLGSARAASRNGDGPNDRGDFVGFRVVCSSPSSDTES